MPLCGFDTSYGLPSIVLPSGNPRRATLYNPTPSAAMSPTGAGVEESLWDKLFAGRAISLDITKPGLGMKALRMSTTDIPTADYLQAGLTKRWNT